jgi:glycosyltransferase involved in cell wall biosynthesis
MLDSIARQSLKSLEIIIVNEVGSELGDELLAFWRDRRLNLRLVQNREHLGPHLSRMVGMEMAEGRALLFADADDVLWGTEALKKNVRTLLDEKLDILEFGGMVVDEKGLPLRPFKAEPPGGFLENPELFSAFCRRGRIRNHVLWNLLLSRSLCRRAGADSLLRNPGITRSEDRYFKLFLMLYARNYASTPECGYGYHDAKNYRKALAASASTMCEIIWNVIPELHNRGYNADDLQSLRTATVKQSQKIVKKMFVELHNKYGLNKFELNDDVLYMLREQALGSENLERFLIIGYPLDIYDDKKTVFLKKIKNMPKQCLKIVSHSIKKSWRNLSGFLLPALISLKRNDSRK